MIKTIEWQVQEVSIRRLANKSTDQSVWPAIIRTHQQWRGSLIQGAKFEFGANIMRSRKYSKHTDEINGFQQVAFIYV